MIKDIKIDTIVEDRNQLQKPNVAKFDNKIMQLTEEEYNKLSPEVKNNGTTYLTYNAEDEE